MERWVTVKRLHQAALERDPSQRAVFLGDACGGDDALRREVESLLAYETGASSFIEAPAVEIAAKTLRGTLDALLVGQTLSRYHVESLLGAGGIIVRELAGRQSQLQAQRQQTLLGAVMQVAFDLLARVLLGGEPAGPRLGEIVDRLVELGHKLQHAPERHAALTQALRILYENELRAHGSQLASETIQALLAPDVELNAQGMGVWLDRA